MQSGECNYTRRSTPARDTESTRVEGEESSQIDIELDDVRTHLICFGLNIYYMSFQLFFILDSGKLPKEGEFVCFQRVEADIQLGLQRWVRIDRREGHVNANVALEI